MEKTREESKDDAKSEEDESMCDISEHDAKEEGEGDDIEECRVDFLIVGYSISF
jgi:hypothetical protein